MTQIARHCLLAEKGADNFIYQEGGDADVLSKFCFLRGVLLEPKIVACRAPG